MHRQKPLLGYEVAAVVDVTFIGHVIQPSPSFPAFLAGGGFAAAVGENVGVAADFVDVVACVWVAAEVVGVIIVVVGLGPAALGVVAAAFDKVLCVEAALGVVADTGRVVNACGDDVDGPAMAAGEAAGEAILE